MSSCEGTPVLLLNTPESTIAAGSRDTEAPDVNPIQCEPLSDPTDSCCQPEQHPRLVSANALAGGTPEPSPVSCTASVQEGCGNISKKVEFSPWTTSSDISSHSLIRPLPPSRECRSPKPILKLGRYSPPVLEEVVNGHENQTAVLESSLVQLAEDAPQLRLDAYSTLCSALRTTAEFLDSQKRKAVVQSLPAFILKDLERHSDGVMTPSATNLALQALKLLMIISWDKTLAADLTDAQRCFLLDHSIMTLEECKGPKAVLLHHLHFLSTQDFSRIMTTSRAVRILEAIKDISLHVKGNGITSERLMVYHRVLQQARSAFKTRPSWWIGQLLAGLTCPVANTRTRAVNLGYRAALLLGPSPSIATALRDLLDTTERDGDVLSSTTCKRLMRMLKQGDEARHVPQIWAVVILLMGGLGAELNRWHRLHDWLRIIQKCFNCGDPEVRIEANKAWDKLVYVVRPHKDTRSFLSKMLIKPVLVQLQRPTNGKQSKNARTSAFASYCNLLYYDLMPSSSFEYYDAVWDEHLSPALKEPFLSGEQNADRACRVLMSLCWKGRVRPWREKRALEAGVVEPEQLPLLDCRWIRSRIPSVLALFKTLFCFSSWGLPSCSETAYIAVAWQSLAKALGKAGQKEIIASAETSEAIRSVSQFLVDICRTGPASLKSAEEDFASRFHFITKTMISELGPMTFLDGFASSPMDLSFAPRKIRVDPVRRALILDLLEAMQQSPTIFPSESYSNMISDLLQTVGRAYPSVAHRIRFYRRCSETILTLDSPCEARPRMLWTALAKEVCNEMVLQKINACDNADFQDVIADIEKILEQGIPYQANGQEPWSALVQEFFQLVNGAKGSALHLVQRLTTCLKSQASYESHLCTAVVLNRFLSALPLSTTGHTHPWQQSATEERPDGSVANYKEVVGLLDFHLSKMYNAMNPCSQGALESLIDAAILLLRSSPAKFSVLGLTEMQESLATWFRGDDCSPIEENELRSLKLEQAQKLCPVVINMLQKLNTAIDVKAFDRLFSAAFKTSHRKIFGPMVEMWSSTYAKKSMEYGDLLQEALSCLAILNEIEFPSLHGMDPCEMSEPSPDSFETLEDDGRSVRSGNGDTTPQVDQVAPEYDSPPIEQRRYSPADNTVAQSTSIEINSNALSGHGDSQVHSMSIESSPWCDQATEPPDLTACQQDACGRQECETAVLFPARRWTSDAECKTAEEEVADPGFAGPDEGFRGHVSPTTPSPHARRSMIYEEAIRQSPTPKSKQQELRLEDIEETSSPHSVPEAEEDDFSSEECDLSTCRNEEILPSAQLTTNAVRDRIMDSKGQGIETKSGSTFTKPLEDIPSRRNKMADDGGWQCPQGSSGVQGKSLANTDREATARSTMSTMEDYPSGTHSGVDPGRDAGEGYVLASDESQSGIPGPWSAMAELVNTQGNILDAALPQDVGLTDGGFGKGLETMGRSTAETAGGELAIHSDEIDSWSASQLSYELETAASSLCSHDMMAPTCAGVSALGKRQRSPSTQSGGKRTKSSWDAAASQDIGETSSNQSGRESARKAEVFDCVEVASQSSSQASSVSDWLRWESGGPQSPAHIRRDSTASEKSVAGRGGISNECDAIKHKPRASQGSVGEKPEEQENPAPAGEVMQLLQKALSRLRNSSMDRLELRAIDDMVFEIRIEAQNALQRRHGNSA